MSLAAETAANRPKAYAELETRFHRWTALKDGRAVLEWDQATMMPDGGSEARAEQVAAMDVVCHAILADPATGDLLAGAEAAAGELDPWQHANLAEMRRLQPGLQVHVVADAGHSVQSDQPLELVRLIRESLAEISSSG